MNQWRNEQACVGKIRYNNRRDAQNQKLSMISRGKDRGHLSVYECSACHGWHVGNDANPVHKRRAKQKDAARAAINDMRGRRKTFR